MADLGSAGSRRSAPDSLPGCVAPEEAVPVRYDFATQEPPRLRFGLGAGRIEVETADTAETTVEVEVIRGDVEDLKVEQHGRDIVVESRKRLGFKSDQEFDIRIRAPHGSDVDANVASAPFRATGRLGALEVNSATGNVQVEDVEREAKVRSASGDVQLGTIGGRADINTASGDVEIASAAGGGTIRSASGDVEIGEAASRVSLNTASGDMVIGSIAEGSVDVKSASGDVRVGVKQGSRLHVDARSLSGDTTSEVELGGVEVATGGPLVEVKGTTMSGDIRIVRA
jgi:putative adhesin